MYKRDRARKLQMMRQRQMAVQSLRGSQYGILGGDGAISFSYQSGLSSPFNTLNIKQEIQIPQVSSLTSSPDSSPSPIAVALGQAANLNSIAAASANNSQQSALQIVATGPTGNGPANANNSTGSAGNGLSLSDHKLWGTPNSTTPSPHSISPKTFQFEGNSSSNTNKVSPLIRDFISGLDDREWQNSLFSLLQNQTYNQCEVDLFELMCKVLDQNLFSQVDWARNSVFFKDLKVSSKRRLILFFVFAHNSCTVVGLKLVSCCS
jgi:nuclear receptor subfamily 5 group A protein 3